MWLFSSTIERAHTTFQRKKSSRNYHTRTQSEKTRAPAHSTRNRRQKIFLSLQPLATQQRVCRNEPTTYTTPFESEPRAKYSRFPFAPATNAHERSQRENERNKKRQRDIYQPTRVYIYIHTYIRGWKSGRGRERSIGLRLQGRRDAKCRRHRPPRLLLLLLSRPSTSPSAHSRGLISGCR